MPNPFWAPLGGRLGVRTNFYDEMLADIDAYAQRYGRDVGAMNAAVQARGLPPVLGIVVDGYSTLDRKGRLLAELSEEKLAKAGTTVVPSAPSTAASKAGISVSVGSRATNEEAHVIWAGMLRGALVNHPHYNVSAGRKLDARGRGREESNDFIAEPRSARCAAVPARLTG